MRIALVHNPHAGDGDLEAAELRRLLEVQGHEVKDFGLKEDDVRKGIDWRPDILAIAGGDGTVARAVTTSFEHAPTVPIGILAVGTANNIARSMKLDRTASTFVQTLAAGRRTALDIGRIQGPWGETLFLESAGVGFMGAMLRNPLSRIQTIFSGLQGALTRTGLDVRMARGVARIIRKQLPRIVTLRADGRDWSGEYVSVVAMNIREIGPNICLAPNASVGDGYLDLALVRPEDRETVADHIERRATADMQGLTQTRARRIELSWEPECGHVDDEPWPDGGVAGMATLSIAGAVAVLQP